MIRPRDKATLSWVAELLDWTLTPALVLAVPSAVVGGWRMAQSDHRWSQGALVWAMIGAFSGVAGGLTGWATWVVNRWKGFLLGVCAGLLTGLAASIFFRVLSEPLLNVIARSPENFFTAIKTGLNEWVSSALPRRLPESVDLGQSSWLDRWTPGDLLSAAVLALLVALTVGLVARLRARNTSPPRPAGGR
jgi:hypothetical protein